MQSKFQAKRVLDFMRKNAPNQYNTKTISKILKIPLNSEKVILYRLTNYKKIFHKCKGNYVANIDISLLLQLENPPSILHGIMLECKTTKTLQKVINGIPSKLYTDEALMQLNSFDFQLTTNYRYYRDLWYEFRLITITVHLKGKADIYINSGDNPLTYPDFLKMLI